jgi:hypothetical protein
MDPGEAVVRRARTGRALPEPDQTARRYLSGLGLREEHDELFLPELVTHPTAVLSRAEPKLGRRWAVQFDMHGDPLGDKGIDVGSASPADAEGRHPGREWVLR